MVSSPGLCDPCRAGGQLGAHLPSHAPPSWPPLTPFQSLPTPLPPSSAPCPPPRHSSPGVIPKKCDRCCGGSRDRGPTHSCEAGQSCRPRPPTRTTDPGIETGHVPHPPPSRGPRQLRGQPRAHLLSLSVRGLQTGHEVPQEVPTGSRKPTVWTGWDSLSLRTVAPAKPRGRPTADSGAGDHLPGPGLGPAALHGALRALLLTKGSPTPPIHSQSPWDCQASVPPCDTEADLTSHQLEAS